MTTIMASFKGNWAEKIIRQIGLTHKLRPIYLKTIEMRKSTPKDGAPFKVLELRQFCKFYTKNPNFCNVAMCGGFLRCDEQRLSRPPQRRREGVVKGKIKSAFAELEEIQHIKQEILLMLALPEEQYRQFKEKQQ